MSRDKVLRTGAELERELELLSKARENRREIVCGLAGRKGERGVRRVSTELSWTDKHVIMLLKLNGGEMWQKDLVAQWPRSYSLSSRAKRVKDTQRNCLKRLESLDVLWCEKVPYTCGNGKVRELTRVMLKSHVKTPDLHHKGKLMSVKEMACWLDYVDLVCGSRYLRELEVLAGNIVDEALREEVL